MMQGKCNSLYSVHVHNLRRKMISAQYSTVVIILRYSDSNFPSVLLKDAI